MRVKYVLTHTLLELETNKDIKKDQEAAPLQEMLQNCHI